MVRESEPAAAAAADAGDDQGQQSGMNVLNRTRPVSVTIPFYVIERFGYRLRPFALSVYVALWYHASRSRRAAWPSLNTIALEIGCSRSSVERAMRVLRREGLVEVEAHKDRRGQHSNTVYLVDPPELPELPHWHPGNFAGGAVRGTGGRRPADGAPPSSGRRPPVSATAPTVGGSSEVDTREGAPPPGAALPPKLADVERVAAAFMGQLVCPAPPIRSQIGVEIRAEVAELLRRGYPVDHLLSTIYAADRERTEYPRAWRARVARSRPCQDASRAAETAQRRAENQRIAEEAAESRKRDFGSESVSFKDLRERRRKSCPETP